MTPQTTQTAPKIHPQRKKRVRTALNIFSVTAWITGVFLILLVIRMIMEYLLKVDLPTWATMVAIFHGWAYMAYLLATLNLGLKARWKPVVWFTTAISGVVPLLSFFIESNRRREVVEKFQLDRP